MKGEARGPCVLESSPSSSSDSQPEEMQLSSEFSGHLVRVKLEPPDVPCLLEEGQTQQKHCNESSSGGSMAGMCYIKEEPREDSSNKHPIVEVKTEPYNVAILTEPDHIGHNCDSTPEGSTAGMCDIKEEPREDSSNERPIIEVKTEPYNIAVLTEQVQTRHSCESTSVGRRRSTAALHNKDQPTGICDQAPSSCTFAKAHISTTEPRFDNTELGTMDIAHLRLPGHQLVHMQTHKTEKPCKCDLCPAVFIQKLDLLCHKRTHTGERPYNCDLCPAAFNQSTDLKRHKRTHTGEKPYKCDVCPAEFNQSIDLIRHKRMHTGEKPYKCDVCPAEFSRNGYLRDHKWIHTGEKQYKCDLCPAEFSRIGRLRDHKRAHTGEKPYKCDICPAEFSQSIDLKRHKRMHTGEKPYKCDVCPAEFSRNGYLRDHKWTHTGEKPYKCHLCPAEFRQSQSLQRHKRTHTGEKQYKCDVRPA